MQEDVEVDKGRGELARRGLTHVKRTFATPEDAWRWARGFVDDDDGIDTGIEVIGIFVIPPPEGPSGRDFQTLHFDFGLPLVPVGPADVARLTALHVPAEVPATTAITRFVPLRPLLNARRWPDHDELVSRFATYGESHGTWAPGTGYSEGSLARVVEAALGAPPALPSVRDHPGFLCGTEFATLADETHFFAQRGLPVDDVVVDVCLQPGELLLFDNLALAHGRRGSRGPGELHQRVFGHHAMSCQEQIPLRDRVLANFRS
jgi:hypothetical protein